MISDDQVRAYRRDGVIVVPNVLDAETLARLRAIVAELVTGAAGVSEHNEVYDLEPVIRPRRRGCAESRRRTRCIPPLTLSSAASLCSTS